MNGDQILVLLQTMDLAHNWPEFQALHDMARSSLVKANTEAKAELDRRAAEAKAAADAEAAKAAARAAAELARVKAEEKARAELDLRPRQPVVEPVPDAPIPQHEPESHDHTTERRL